MKFCLKAEKVINRKFHLYLSNSSRLPETLLPSSVSSLPPPQFPVETVKLVDLTSKTDLEEGLPLTETLVKNIGVEGSNNYTGECNENNNNNNEEKQT